MSKILLLNGSPHKNGCTARALSEITYMLQTLGLETQTIHLGTGPFEGCRACGYCRKNGFCVIDDIVNEIAVHAKTADGFIFGSPVHYAGISGALKIVLDRLSFSGGSNLAYKPGAGVVSCRRAGSTAALDQLNKYFTINHMPIVSSQYWNMVHGGKAEDVELDLEGLQTMRDIAMNFAWLVKSLEGESRISEVEPRVWTNFADGKV